MGASSDLDQPFRPRQKSWVWVGGRIGYSEIKQNRASGFAMFLLRELIPNINRCALNFNEGDCSANFE